MNYEITFNDGTTKIIEAPDRKIARVWAKEDDDYHDLKVKSVKEVK